MIISTDRILILILSFPILLFNKRFIKLFSINARLLRVEACKEECKTLFSHIGNG